MTVVTNPPTPAANPRSDGAGRDRRDGLLRLLWHGLIWLAQLVGFLAWVVDELVTARLGVPPVLPRLRRWGHRLVAEWRVHRAVRAGELIEADVIEGGVIEGVWR